MQGIEKGDALLVTTAHRGVFFGYYSAHDSGGKVVTLTKSRNCVYWPAETKGFLGLAHSGPPAGSRVGPAVEELTLQDVTAVARVSTEAVARWEESPWR